MRLPERPPTPYSLLNALRLNLLQLRQPHGVGFLNRQAFELAWGQFDEWRETPSGRARIDTARAIAADEGGRELRLPTDLPSQELVREMERLRCVEDPVLNVRDLAPEIHAEFAIFAFWQTGRDPEREWRAYSGYAAQLRALRGAYETKLQRTPIGRCVLEILYGDPARQEERVQVIVRILVSKVWPLQASSHRDPGIRAEETEDAVRDYVHRSLQQIQPVSWGCWLPRLLDRKVITTKAARRKVIDGYRSSVRRERPLVALDEADAAARVPRSLTVDEEYPDVLGPRRWVRSMASWIDARAGSGSAAILEFYLNPEIEGVPSQAAVAAAVGLSPRTTWSRLRAIRRDPEVRALLREHIGT